MNTSIWHSYLTIARAALADARETQASRVPCDAPQFLPAALEIMQSPPNPLGRGVLLALCGMVLIGLIWSLIGSLDVVVVSPGKVLPHSGVQVVSWGGAGGGEGTTAVVRAVHVSDGDHVRQGQVLIELDPTLSGADAAQAQRGLTSAEVEQARSRALVGYLATGHVNIDLPSDLPATEQATQVAWIRSSIAEYEAKASGLRQARAERAADQGAAQTERLKLQETLVLLDKELAARSDLAAKGFQSKIGLYQLQQVRIERARTIQQQEIAAGKARAAMAGMDDQLRQLRQELTKGSLVDLAKASDDASVRREEITKANRRNALLQIRAPAAGTVEQLQARTLGGSVQSAQPLLTIVPQAGRLVVETEVENRDVGFIRVGQAVSVKVQAFPFTEFGVLHGSITSISSDAVTSQAGGGAHSEGVRAPVFVARIALDRAAMMVGDCDHAGTPSSRCKAVPLTPGMALQAEIKTGRRRIIDYMLSPLSKSIQEAGRER